MQLLYPWFLVGLLGVTIPVVIHLLHLRQPQRVLFSNTAFIRKVELITVKHRRVQNLLILLTRILAVILLVLAFCQPFISVKKRTTSVSENGVDVLVDNSFSMQLPNSAHGSLFEGALAEAKAFGESTVSTQRFRLINSGTGLITRTAYLAKLNDLRVSVRSLFSKLSSDISGQGRSSLYLFSDFQKNSFNGTQLNGFGTGREVVLVPIGAKPAANVYVDSVWLDDAFVRVRASIALHVRLRNGGNLAANDCPVKVFLGERQVAVFRVTVGVGQVVASVVQIQVDKPKLALGRVVTEDAPVTFDNTYFFTLQPATVIRVLEIGAEPVAKQLYGNEPLFAYAFANPQNIDYGAMRQANMVLLHEANNIDAGLLDGLRAVLKRGGSVVVVPSPLTAGRASYQQLFKNLGLGAVQWEEKTETPELRAVAVPDAQEPFFRNVFGAQQREVTMPRVAPVLRWARTRTDILRLRDGESYLADFASGAGRVYVFSAPFAKEYSDFVAHALFVPVMYRMAMLSYRNEQLPAYRLAQGTVTLQVPVAEPDASDDAATQADEAGFRIVKDKVTLIPAQRTMGQQVRLDLPAGMDEPGFYQVVRRGKVLTTLAFNQLKQESELAAYSADELRQMIGPNRPNIRVLEGGADGASLGRFRAEQPSQPLWRYCLAAALVCLLAEALLVRFGGRLARTKKAVLAS